MQQRRINRKDSVPAPVRQRNALQVAQVAKLGWEGAIKVVHIQVQLPAQQLGAASAQHKITAYCVIVHETHSRLTRLPMSEGMEPVKALILSDNTLHTRVYKPSSSQRRVGPDSRGKHSHNAGITCT